jgi:hypothetical protein
VRLTSEDVLGDGTSAVAGYLAALVMMSVPFNTVENTGEQLTPQPPLPPLSSRLFAAPNG